MLTIEQAAERKLILLTELFFLMLHGNHVKIRQILIVQGWQHCFSIDANNFVLIDCCNVIRM